jgi:hypothetical protein
VRVDGLVGTALASLAALISLRGEAVQSVAAAVIVVAITFLLVHRSGRHGQESSELRTDEPLEVDGPSR